MEDTLIDVVQAGALEWFPDWGIDSPRPELVPAHLAHLMPGVELVLREWKTYRLRIPNATALWVNNKRLTSVFEIGYFTLSFENELGLSTLTPEIDGVRQESRHVEVIAGKFHSTSESLRFTRSIVDQLSARVSTLPFVVSAATAKQIQRQHREPNAFFAFHYLRHHGDTLIRALQIITADPHRRLGDVVEDLRIHQARRIDAEALHSLLTGPRAGEPNLSVTATPLEKLQPLRIAQRRPEESWDTAENRFVVAVCNRLRHLLSAMESTWWFQQNALESDRTRFLRIARTIRLLLRSDRFQGVPASLRLPAYSRVLQNKPGYRDLMVFWNGLTQVHQPVLSEISKAIDLRDVPTLYEYWLFFELATAIAARSGVAAHFPTVMDPYAGTGGLSARFPGLGVLDTQQSFGKGTVYTGINLRPDFVWTTNDGQRVALDAKFAMDSFTDLQRADEETAPASWATSRDITKMHAYRDAIGGVDAALVLFPGTNGRFWELDGGSRAVSQLDDVLHDVITGRLSGIGAVPMKPTMGEI